MVSETVQLPKPVKLEPGTPRSVIGATKHRDSLEDPDGVLASVAQCIEQLRGAAFSPQDKEQASKKLLGLLETRENAKKAIASHTQAIPLLVNFLRTGTTASKINVASIMAVLCKEEDLRMKVLLGGCIPPLLALLKLGSNHASAAARAIYAVTQAGGTIGGTTGDHVGAKIFSTEGVVPSLWEQFQPGNKWDMTVLGLLTGALRNLCGGNVEGYWSATMDAGGVEVLVALLQSKSPEAQANACAILNAMIGAVDASGGMVYAAGGTSHIFQLLSPGNETPVRAEAAGALRALTANSAQARAAIENQEGVKALIGAVVAPSKEYMQGVFAQALQENAMGALANVMGGLSVVITSLAENVGPEKPESYLSDIIGALAYALMIIDSDSYSADRVNPVDIEKLLARLFQHKSELVHERVLEALASLFGNNVLAVELELAEAKKMLVGLITMADPWIRDELIKSLVSVCSGKLGLWEAIRGRDGVQFIISLLGVSSEQQQEHAAALLSILSQNIDESNWAITACGGIPPLLQLLETGSVKAKEESAFVLGNLCSHSEDIRACVETAEAEPAFLWLLKNAGEEGQAIAARALIKLVKKPDADTMSQLSAMAVAELPVSKEHVLEVMAGLLSLVPKQDVAEGGGPSYDALVKLKGLLENSRPETQEKAAAVLADLIDFRKDWHDSALVEKTVPPLSNLLAASEGIAAQAARALGALFYSIQEHEYIKNAARDLMTKLIDLSKSANLALAEAALKALANLLLDKEVALDVPTGDVLVPITRVLQEGTAEGKNEAARALARVIVVHSLDNDMVEIVHGLGTVRALAEILTTVNFSEAKTSQPLEALSAMARAKCDTSVLLRVIAETTESLKPFVTCVAVGEAALCDKAVEVMARLGQDQADIVGDLIVGTPGCIEALVSRIINSPKMEVKAGGTQLLISASKDNRKTVLEVLESSGSFFVLIQALVGMLSAPSTAEGDDPADDSAVAHGTHVALWLLSIIATHDSKSKVSIMEADAIDVLAEKLAIFAPNARQASEESGNTSASALLLAILFQDRDVSRAPATLRAIPALSMLLKSDETFDRFFSAQALANLVCHGSRGTLLAVANSGAVSGLISLLGSAETKAPNVAKISEQFSLLENPDQVALERLFRVEDIKFGATARKAIPVLVDLLKPIPGRPGAPPLALGLLTQIAEASSMNRMTMAEAGALDALTKYISLGPQDAYEEAAAELLRILFSTPELRRHDSAFGAVDQLIAVLRIGARGSRYTAARALQELFNAEHIKAADAATGAIPPLSEMLGSALEREQSAAIGALISLSQDNPVKAVIVGDAEFNTLEILSKILSAETTSLQLKERAAELCGVLFANARVRKKAAATNCVPPLIDMLGIEVESLQQVATRALENLLEDEQQAEAVAAYGAVVPLVGLVAASNHSAHEVAVSALIKLGQDRPLCKLDMVKAGVIESCLDNLQTASGSFCLLAAELLRILTNNTSIASKSSSASKVVEPLFLMLSRPDISSTAQEAALHTLVNIIEKPQCVAMQRLTSSQALDPLVQLIDSPSQSVQEVAAHVLSYVLVEDRFQKDPITQGSIMPLVRLTGTGILSVQQKAVKALELASQTWPEAVADAGGISEVSRIILQVEPPAPHTLWESAAKVLSNILNSSSHQEFPLPVIVKLLRSSSEQTISTALHTLLLIERDDALTAEAMADAGAIESLVEILRCHQCEESAARLLESIVNNVKVRELKVTKLAICPLSEFLLDAQTQSEQARLLAALALGDLFQNEILAKSSDAVSACRAFVSLLEGQHAEELQMVAICALQNLVAGSRPNRRAVAEAGGIPALQELVASGNPETTMQAAALIRILFSTYTIQDFVSIEIVQALLASLEKDIWARAPLKEDILRSINTLFNLYPKFRTSETATASIPLLVGALKSEFEIAQEAALDTLFLFSQTWSEIPAEESSAQAVAMAEAIPMLQMLMRTGPQRFHERTELLLQCLPGNLLVNIKRGNNLKQSMGGTNAFCKITLGNGPPRLTRVVSNSTSPEWEQGFAWAFETPPKGQKLHISCKNKGALFGKGSSLGKVTIQIDRVVMLGTLRGEYQLKPVTNRDGSQRTLEIEFQWSNR